MVREAGCDLAQGWLLGHAMPAEEIPGWVRPVQAAGGDLCALALARVRGGPGRVIGRRHGPPGDRAGRAAAPADRAVAGAARARGAGRRGRLHPCPTASTPPSRP